MNIQNNFYQNNLPNFKSCARSYYNIDNNDAPAGNTVYTTTFLFRNDVDWMWLAKYLNENFKDKKEIKTYSVACSDGSEPYTYAIALNEALDKQDLKKFKPIIASDKDDEIISVAQSGKINLSSADLCEMYETINSDKTYFKKVSDKMIDIKTDICKDSNMCSTYEPIPQIKCLVKFKKSDIIDQIERIEDNGNSVVMCRNVTPYLDKNYRYKLAETLKQQLKPGSIVITGKFDLASNFEKLLLAEQFGIKDFEKITDNVFRRIDNNNKLGVSPEYDTNKYLG